ncbi:MAG: YfdX family protein [Methylohalobius crimeensis]
MKRKYLSRYGAMTIVALFGLMTAFGDAMAASKNAEKILDKVSKEGRSAMREVRWARVAIFDGQPKEGEKMLERAEKNLAKLEKQAPELVVTIKTKEKIGGKTVDRKKMTETSDLVPIDAGLELSEDFVTTPEKQKKIEQANKHLKKGETDKAIEALREADIGISISRVLLPVKGTIKHVDKAMDLIKAHKYYEANLALKAVEDGEIVDTVLLYEPTQAPAPNSKS